MLDEEAREIFELRVGLGAPAAVVHQYDRAVFSHGIGLEDICLVESAEMQRLRPCQRVERA